MLEPDIETRPWPEQLALDDEAYRRAGRLSLRALALLPGEARRGRLRSAGGASAGWTSPPCPSPRKTRSAQAAPPRIRSARILPFRATTSSRIYSTSGTTGTPSYIPLTARDLDNWVTTSARSYSASGVAAGEAIVSTYNAGPFVAGAALGRLRPARHVPHSGRHRQHRAADDGDPPAEARQPR